MTPSYPLAWPPAWPRTEDWRRSKGPFQMPAGKTRYELKRELYLLGATNVVISSNVMVRADGMPYARQPKVDDPGVCLYFTLKGNEVAMPCDRWNTVDANLRAIGMAVEAIRGMERWGTGQMVEAAFRGFKALPETVIITPNSARPWHEVLQVSPDADHEIVRAAWKRLVSRYHPDNQTTGDAVKFQEVQRAYREATS